MKILISLSTDIESYMLNSHKARDYLYKDLHETFGYGFNVKVEVPDTGENVGYLWVYLSNVAPRCSTFQHDNASLKLKFRMPLTDASGKQTDIDDFKFELVQVSEAVLHLGLQLKFNAYSSPLSAAKDLAHWFKLNAKKLESIKPNIATMKLTQHQIDQLRENI